MFGKEGYKIKSSNIKSSEGLIISVKSPASQVFNY